MSKDVIALFRDASELSERDRATLAGLLIESLERYHHFYGDTLKVECPTGSGRFLNLDEVADELRRRLGTIFLADEQGYCRRYGLDDVQCLAVAGRDVMAMIAAGGNVYYLAKLAGIFGLGVQDLGALQTGMTVEQFRAKLLAQAEEA